MKKYKEKLLNKFIVWLARYFPFLLKWFDIKVLEWDMVDITPSQPSGFDKKPYVESKVSFVLNNISYLDISLDLIFSYLLEDNVRIQIYPIDENFQPIKNPNPHSIKMEFDSNEKKMYSRLTIPSKSLRKIDYFSCISYHPLFKDGKAFQMVFDENDSTRCLKKDFFNRKDKKIILGIKRILLIIFLAIPYLVYRIILFLISVINLIKNLS